MFSFVNSRALSWQTLAFPAIPGRVSQGIQSPFLQLNSGHHRKFQI